MMHPPSVHRERILIAQVVNACDRMQWEHRRLVAYHRALVRRARLGSGWHPEQTDAIQVRALSRLMYRGIRSADDAYRLFDGPDADAVWNGVTA